MPSKSPELNFKIPLQVLQHRLHKIAGFFTTKNPLVKGPDPNTRQAKNDKDTTLTETLDGYSPRNTHTECSKANCAT